MNDKETYYRTCESCGRPMAYCKGQCCGKTKGCQCKEYCGKVCGAIRPGEPKCPPQAVIPSLTVESVSNLKDLADCFVHVSDINTTFYIDDKHRIMTTWAGLVSVEDYDFDANPLNLRGQIAYDSKNNVAAIYDKQGANYIFQISDINNDYMLLENKPQINGVTLEGNKTSADLGVPDVDEVALVFDTVADMKAATNLIAGSFAKTLGYYSVSDGGQSLYKIRAITAYDVIDDGSLIDLDDDTLVAELVPVKEVNIKQFGAKGDGTTVDTTAIQNAIYYAYDHSLNVYIPSGTFAINKPLVLLSSSNELNKSFKIYGDGQEDTKLLFEDVTAISSISNVNGTYGFMLLNESWLNSSRQIISGSGTTGRISITDMTLTCSDHSCSVGIYMPISTFGCSFKRMRICGFDNEGINANNNFYLSVCEQIRVDNSARSFYIHNGTHTSLKFDSCYSTGASTSAYEVSGIYNEMNNCCADGCTGTVFNLTGYSGTVVSPGSESDHAACMFKGGQYTNVTIVGAYTWGNYTDSGIFHVDTGVGSSMIFVGGYIGVDSTATNRVMPGGIVKTDYLANIKFIGTRFGKYATNNTHSQSGTNIEHNISNGSLLTRYGNKLAYIGFDGKTGNDNNKAGYVDGEASTPQILGNAIFFGLGDDAGHTADGVEVRYNVANNKGDILLTRNVKETGGLGWVQTNANRSEWGLTVNATTSDYVKIPVVLAGATADRPTKSLLTGQMYYDTTLNKPIFFVHGTGWVDATGTTV